MSIIYSVSVPVKQEHLVLFGLVLRISCNYSFVLESMQ